MIGRILAVTLVVLVGFVFLSTTPTQLVSAQASLSCDGLTPNEEGGDCTTPQENAPTVESVLEDALELLSILAGVIAVGMIIYAGVKFVMSQGDSGKVTSARHTALYAIIGLIIAAMAQTIIYFVLNDTINPEPQAPQKVCPASQNCAE